MEAESFRGFAKQNIENDSNYGAPWLVCTHHSSFKAFDENLQPSIYDFQIEKCLC